MTDLLQRLRERKLGQWALAYLAGAWVLLQGLDLIGHQFDWPTGLLRGITVVLGVGFFTTLVLAWYHGERGVQKVSSIELLILALLLAIGGALLWRFARTAQEATPAAAAAKPAATSEVAPAKSIAVLAFNDLSPGHDQGYFSDGMAEEILNALAQVKDLKVAGRTSSFYFKGRNEDLRTIGQTLGVAYILEGSVRKQGDKVRITAQLIHATDDFHAWSESYDGDLSDVFQLQENIARSITDALKVVLVGDQKTRLVPVATTSPDAYPLYLQATAIFDRRDGPHFPDAIADLQQAIRLDPKYARAHARLASMYAIANTYNNTLNLTQSLAAAEHEAAVAIALDPTLGEPYAALGTIYELRRQWVNGRQASERAVALEPGDPTANFWLGLAQIDAGYRRLGVASIDRALAIDPLLPNALAWRAFSYFDAGDRANARRMAQQSVDEGLLFGEVVLAMLAHNDGRESDAIAHFNRSAFMTLKGFPDDATAILAQGIYGDAARHARAVAMIDTYLASRPGTIAPRTPWAFLMLGEPARALAVAQEPQASNDTLFLVWLWSSRGATARQLPQFPVFARKIGLTDVWEKYGPPDDCKRKGPGDYVCE
jgi:TolB-like protein/Tfp pilus assembly protein PilF